MRRLRWIIIAGVATIACGWALKRARANIGSPATAQWKKCYGAASLGPASLYQIPELTGTRVQFNVVGGNKLYALNAEGSGTPFWTNTGLNPMGLTNTCNNSGLCGGMTTGPICQTFPAPIDHVPIPVKLSSSGNYVLFVPAEDGVLYKVNAQSGAIMGSIDLKRPGCTNDKLKAPVVVEQARFKQVTDPFVQVYGGHDIVFVPTSFDTSGACASTSANRIYAIDAETMTTAWDTGIGGTQMAFNNPYLFGLNEGIEGCELDDSTNDMLYCTFRSSGTQNTIVALKTHNSGGSPAKKYVFKWAKNAGDIEVRPFLRNGSLFVAENTGHVKSYNASTGVVNWSVLTACDATLAGGLGCNFLNNTWAESRNGVTSTILALSKDGALHSILDSICTSSGTSLPCGVEQWHRLNSYVTEPVVDPYYAKIYIGTSGVMQQLDLPTGSIDGYVTVDAAAGTMGDPALDSISPSRIDRLSVGVGTGVIARLCPPWPTGTSTAIRLDPPSPTDGIPRPPEPLPIIGACNVDADCLCYDCDPQNLPPGCTFAQCRNGTGPYASRQCNTLKCDFDANTGIGTHTCYVAHVPNGTACNDNNTCTNPDRCVDGICTGPIDPTRCGTAAECNTGNVGAECNGGQCCLDSNGIPQCQPLSTNLATCGLCSTGCGNVACVGGVCCNDCGTGSCVDLNGDPNHCGTCTTVCRTGTTQDVCVQGQCEQDYTNVSGAQAFADACALATHITVFGVGLNDPAVVSIDWPFGSSFKFFGRPVTGVIWISVNGVMGFNGQDSTNLPITTCLPSVVRNAAGAAPQMLPRDAIFIFGEDVNTGRTGTVCAGLDSAFPNGGRFLITWKGVSLTLPGGSVDSTTSLNFTIAMYPNTSDIDLMYGAMTSTNLPARARGSQATVGFEDDSGLNYLEVMCHQSTGITQNTSKRYHPQ